MAGIGKQLRGSGLAKIINKSIQTKRKGFDAGGMATADLPNNVISNNILTGQPMQPSPIAPIVGYKKGGRVKRASGSGSSGEMIENWDQLITPYEIAQYNKKYFKEHPEETDEYKAKQLKNLEDSNYNTNAMGDKYKKGGKVKSVKSAKKGLWYNINRRKKLGISRPKSKSTISAKAYKNMKAGFPK